MILEASNPVLKPSSAPTDFCPQTHSPKECQESHLLPGWGGGPREVECSEGKRSTASLPAAYHDTSMAPSSQAVLAQDLGTPFSTAPPRPKAMPPYLGGHPWILLSRTQVEDGQDGH